MTAIEMDFNRLQRLLTQGGRGAVQAMGQAIYAEAALALLESKELVPVDTSALKQSGNLKPLRVEGKAVEVVIGKSISKKHTLANCLPLLQNVSRTIGWSHIF